MSAAGIAAAEAPLAEVVPLAPPREGIEALLLDPHGLSARALGADAARLAALARSLLLVIATGTAIFGAAVGLYRGGVQILYAAVKLPLVVLFTAVLAAPALTALGVALGRPAALRRDLVQLLITLARGSLVLAALAPVMMVAAAVELGYHQATLLLCTCCAGAGGVGLPILGRALWAEPRGRLLLVTAVTLVVGLAGTQVSWLFRPYLVRPSTTDVPFVRALDGDFIDAVVRSSRSARGIYDGDRP